MEKPPMPIRHMFTPLQVGPVLVPNRVVRTGHATGLGGGTISDALIGYHRERAKGGVGLSILELMSLHSSAYPFLRGGAPGVVEGYRKLMDAVRPYGMRVFQQLGHMGNESPQADGGPPWSSSDSIGASVGVRAESITTRQIEELRDCYVAAAQDCAAGGLNGVELHMAHGYLVQQFLSPLYNRRTDQYGGCFENRTRLAVELLTAVKAVLPSDMALGVRLSSELVEGGMGPDEVARVVGLFSELKLIDYVNLSIGTDYNMHKIIGAMHEPTGYELASDIPVKRQTDLPVIVTGRFRTIEEADQVVGQGDADMVAMNRAHIADPDIVRKTLEGREDEVRPCIGCNHGCIGGLHAVGRIGCTVNPAVGLEDTLSEELIEPSATPRTVLVVGAGPAGLEAARVAALRGHRVILAEASNSLGGSVNIAKRAPRRMGIADITEWLEREVYRLGVDVRLSTFVQSDDVASFAPDAVIIATGSVPRMDSQQMFVPGASIPGVELGHVVSSHDVLMAGHNRDWGRNVLVFDDTGHYEAVAAAEYLAEQGLAVTFATSHGSFAPGLVPSLSADPAMERLLKHDFRFIPYARLSAVAAGLSTIVNRLGGSETEIAADTVVLVQHNAANREVYDDLAASGVSVTIVGDARSPRYLQTAIREGHLAARAL
jgi:2,4-dienoyl-CoA reductase-like NADH-dependent reductase (Old Yellow Enzyme family)/thioredoxin reductase